MVETTALGAALSAGFAVGIWSMHSIKSDCDPFMPKVTEAGKYFLNIHFSIKLMFIIDH